MHTKTSIFSGLILAVSALGACSQRSAQGDWPRYPGHAQDEVADVQVFRDGPELTFTNTTGRTIGPGLLWINAAWSTPIDAIPPGQSATLDLNKCLNEFGQPFRGGGFFANERPDDVVLAQVEDEQGDMIGLLVTTRPSGPS